MVKISIFLAVVAVVAVLAGTTQANYVIKSYNDLTTIRKNCVSKFSLTKEQEQNYLNTNDEKTRCYIKCLFDGFDLVDADGNYIENTYRQVKGTDTVDTTDETYKKIEKCLKDVEGKDDCEKAFHATKCLVAENIRLAKPDA